MRKLHILDFFNEPSHMCQVTLEPLFIFKVSHVTTLAIAATFFIHMDAMSCDYDTKFFCCHKKPKTHILSGSIFLNHFACGT
jgi:hypothetical protein